jgi:hypothetical protein
MKPNLKVQYILPLLIVLLFIATGIHRCFAARDLKKNGVIVHARIVDYLGSAKGGTAANPGYRCSFSYKGRTLSENSKSRVKRKAFSHIGKWYPAMYSERTHTVRLLMFREDFEEFGLEYPDSLANRATGYVPLHPI